VYLKMVGNNWHKKSKWDNGGKSQGSGPYSNVVRKQAKVIWRF